MCSLPQHIWEEAQLAPPSLSKSEEHISVAKANHPLLILWLSHHFLPGRGPSSNLKSLVLLQLLVVFLWRAGRPGHLHRKGRTWESPTKKGCGDGVVEQFLNSTAFHPCCKHFLPTIPETRTFPRSNTKYVTSSVTVTLSIRGRQESTSQCLNTLSAQNL